MVGFFDRCSADNVTACGVESDAAHNGTITRACYSVDDEVEMVEALALGLCGRAARREAAVLAQASTTAEMRVGAAPMAVRSAVSEVFP